MTDAAYSLSRNLPDEAATRAFGARLAGLLRAGDVVALAGGLGMGKTALARALIAAAGGGDEVPSPTFTLVQIYDTRPVAIFHYDLYRLDDPEEAWELDIEEAFANGISLIEWPEHLGRLIPADRLQVTLSPGPTEAARSLELTGFGAWAPRLKRIDDDRTL